MIICKQSCISYFGCRLIHVLPVVVAPPGWLSGEHGCEFDPQLRRLFFPAYFRLSPLQKHVRKVVGGFGKKVLLVLVREN